jgi:polyribonucleotide nucleotidyltransferase
LLLGGVNIKKIRDETQTEIDLPAEGDESNDVIVITGKKENVTDASERIKKIQNELANIITEEIQIPPKYYNSIIGAGGKLISSIMEECGGVSIKFPTPESKSDKVTIRGPKDDVERAKQQLLELSNEKQLSSFTAEVRANPKHHRFLIGKKGASIKKIRDSTGARIIFPSNDDKDKEVITIIGKKESVETAKSQLEAIICEVNNNTEGEMDVLPKYHRHFVARRGEVINKISEECGGVTISFPRSTEPDSTRVTLKGPKEGIEAAKQRIIEIVNDLDSMVTIECVISHNHHRSVMGSRGTKVQAITKDYDVQIKFPDRNAPSGSVTNGDINETTNGDAIASDVIRITGKREKCEQAKQALLDLVPITEEIEVPFDLHRSIIGQKGQGVRELMQNYDVHIELSPQEKKLDVIKVTGAAQNVRDAKEAIAERVKQLEADKQDRELRSYELKLEIEPDLHPKIIGRRGAIINKIRKQHDVQISFPRKEDAESNIIKIQGYESAAKAARDDILKIVGDYNEMVKENVPLDARIHSRIIGQRGRHVRQIMEEYRVDIKFPRDGDANMNQVTGMINLRQKVHITCYFYIFSYGQGRRC